MTSDAVQPDFDGVYAPLVATPAGRPLVFAHLAQSLDGRIALSSGASQWLSGDEDLNHTHRLRALADAVIVGASTVALDNPQLTVRRVPGADPIRVVLDPELRLGWEHRVFSCRRSQTLVVCTERARASSPAPVELLRLPDHDGRIRPQDICDALFARGVRRILVEGGGVTVSCFLNAGCLDRLHLVVAPVILGQGRPSLQLADIAELSEAPRPPVQTYHLGQDMLFDCAFEWCP